MYDILWAICIMPPLWMFNKPCSLTKGPWLMYLPPPNVLINPPKTQGPIQIPPKLFGAWEHQNSSRPLCIMFVCFFVQWFEHFLYTLNSLNSYFALDFPFSSLKVIMYCMILQIQYALNLFHVFKATRCLHWVTYFNSSCLLCVSFLPISL